MNPEPSITGTHIAYYFICARKLWLFAHHIQCETDNDRVYYGKILHEKNYKHLSQHKEIDIDLTIVLDRIDHANKVIHEVKTSKAMQSSHRQQLKFYLWYLENKGIPMASPKEAHLPPGKRGYVGRLDYPETKETEWVYLDAGDRIFFKEELPRQIREIVEQPSPPDAAAWKVCRSCAYCELCHS